jgi:hypothetical protein
METPMNELKRVETQGELAQVQVQQSGQLAQVQPTPMTILSAAVQSGHSPEVLEKLVNLSIQMDKRAAESAFFAALSEFKRTCPPVVRRSINSQFEKVTRDGRTVKRAYASLEDIAATIREPLAACGLSYSWSSTSIEGGKLTMACVVSHIGGHSKEHAVTLPTESRGGANSQQQAGSAMTYAQRYSLINALGLTSCDEDTDGNDDPADVEYITDGQAIELQDLIDHTKTERAKFLAWAGAKTIAEIPASKFAAARAMLVKKLGGGK